MVDEQKVCQKVGVGSEAKVWLGKAERRLESERAKSASGDGGDIRGAATPSGQYELSVRVKASPSMI